MGELEARWGEVVAAEGALAGLPFAEAEARQGEYDRVGAAFERALGRVLRAPAPDVAALGVKIVLLVDHDAGTLDCGEACLAALRRDALRLCSGQAVRLCPSASLGTGSAGVAGFPSA
ncbi:MAG TPA: hypothetical protein VGC35_13000 [Allosphingosinicella sp.]